MGPWYGAKAKERQNELDRLKGAVMQLRREKADLEQQCAKLAISVAKEGERQRTSTMAWIVDHFWLRRKVHLKTLANSVRWMIKGSYKSGMTEAVLRAKEAAEVRKAAEAAEGGAIEGGGYSGGGGGGGGGGEAGGSGYGHGGPRVSEYGHGGPRVSAGYAGYDWFVGAGAGAGRPSSGGR